MRVVRLYLKHDDRTSFGFEDGDFEIDKHSDYLPHVGILGGDDTTLTIDNDTGKIIGWIPITKEDFDE